MPPDIFAPGVLAVDALPWLTGNECSLGVREESCYRLGFDPPVFVNSSLTIQCNGAKYLATAPGARAVVSQGDAAEVAEDSEDAG
jgi:hypothetical protein